VCGDPAWRRRRAHNRQPAHLHHRLHVRHLGLQEGGVALQRRPEVALLRGHRGAQRGALLLRRGQLRSGLRRLLRRPLLLLVPKLQLLPRLGEGGGQLPALFACSSSRAQGAA
jgi:hypothetical protein